MYHLALKMLLGDRAKYVMLVAGLTFASLLMTQQCAVFFGLLSWTTSHLRNMRAARSWQMSTARCGAPAW